MLKNLIIIENKNYIQCDNEEELVKLLIDEDFFKLSKKEKLKKMQLKAMLNSLNTKKNIIELKDLSLEENFQNKFVLIDEKTYILSLLINTNIIILENINSNVYIKYLDKSKFAKNYIIVNHFAKEILKNYLKSLYQ